MERKELAKKIFDVAHITGEFKLRSGAVSNEYFDKYQFEARPELLSVIGKHLYENYVKNLKFDYLAPLEMGGIPISSSISLQYNLGQVLIRKEAKEYGTCKLAEGFNISNKKLLIVEDVVTSGGQIILSANDLRKRGAIVEDAVCVIDREAGGVEKLAAEGIKLHPLFKMSELKAAATK